MRSLTPGIALLFAANAGFAVEYSGGVGYTGEYTSNTRRDSADEVDELIHSPYVQLNLSQQNGAVDVSLSTTVQQRIHSKSEFEDDTIASGTADLNWNAINNLLTLDASYERAQTTVRALAPDTPDNRQETSQLTAGATLTKNLGSHQASVRIEHQETRAETTENDSASNMISASYAVPLSNTQRVTASASFSKPEFDAGESEDLESKSFNLSFTSMGARIDTSLAVGYQDAKRESQSDEDAVTGSADIEYRITTETSLSANFQHGLDYEQNFDRLIPAAGFRETVIGDSDTNDVYRFTSASLTYNFVVARNQISLGGVYDQRDYSELQRKEESAFVTASIGRSLGRNRNLNLFATMGETTSDELDSKDDQISAGLQLTWTPNKRLSCSLSGSYEERSGSDSIFEYEDVSVFLNIYYTLLARR